MDFNRIVFEGGIEALLTEDRMWHLSGGSTLAESLDALAERLGVRPLLAFGAAQSGRPFHTLLRAGGVRSSNGDERDLFGFHTTQLLIPAFAMAYDVSATVYHVTNMARTYSSISADFRQSMHRLGVTGEVGASTNTGSDGLYFEFDAMLSAARRAYDKLGNLVWAAFNNRRGDRPGNLADMLKRRPFAPEALELRLEQSWNEHGRRLKDYRDCSQHVMPADTNLWNLSMKCVEPGVWRGAARIPDNPEVKSRSKFTYNLHLDALTYAWETCSELSDLAADVGAQLPPEM